MGWLYEEFEAREKTMENKLKVSPSVHDEAKYVEEKAKELREMSEHTDREHGFMYAISRSSAEDFIATIVREIEDKYWANEQYHLDTIKELKKQLDEKNPKVSRREMTNFAEGALDSITTSRIVGLLEILLKSHGVEVEE